MTRKKRVPCAPFDIPGMQEWLDEMARQGLFLQEFTWHHDRAVFELKGYERREAEVAAAGRLDVELDPAMD